MLTQLPLSIYPVARLTTAAVCRPRRATLNSNFESCFYKQQMSNPEMEV